MTLRADLPSPFAPQSDEAGKKADESAEKKPDESAGKDQAKPGEKEKKEAEDVAKNFRIDLAGIENRVVAVPMPPANIMRLQGRQEWRLLLHRARLRPFRTAAGRATRHPRVRPEGTQR